MTRNHDMLQNLILNSKSPRAQARGKARKHRHERRRVRSLIRLGDWLENEE